MATITEDYVSFEVAKLLKEKGFDSDKVGCYGGFYSERYYESGHGIKTQSGQEVGIVYDDLTNSDLEHDEYLRPTQQMAMRWLREKHFLHIDITIMNGGSWAYSIEDISIPYDGGIIEKHWDRGYSSYEKAVETAIKYCLENLI